MNRYMMMKLNDEKNLDEELGIKRVLNIYHKNCLDGVGSACAILEYCDQKGQELIQTGLEHKYTEKDFLLLLADSKNVDSIVFTDFTLRYDDMVDLLKSFKGPVLVFDHHSGVEESLVKLKEKFENFNYVFDINRSGAVIIWQHLWENIPSMIYNFQDRDLWKFELKDTKPICSYMYEFIDDIKVFNTKMYDVSKAIEIGTIIDNRRTNMIQNIYEKYLNNHLVLKCKSLPNVKMFNQYEYKSELGNMFSLHHNEPIGIYHIEGDIVYTSFRSCDNQKHTANEYAKEFGGNGHKNASGCRIELKYFLENIRKDE